MLVLSRRANESIVVGNDIIITVLAVKKNSIRLGIKAPPEVSVHRAEVRDRIEFEVSLPTAEAAGSQLPVCV